MVFGDERREGSTSLVVSTILAALMLADAALVDLDYLP